jgi:predicted HTH transcriptional regulator
MKWNIIDWLNFINKNCKDLTYLTYIPMNKKRGPYHLVNNFKRKQLVALVLNDEVSLRDAAKSLGISHSTAKSIIYAIIASGKVEKKFSKAKRLKGIPFDNEEFQKMWLFN